MIKPFEIKKDKVLIPLLVNIPHSSTCIPPEMKNIFLLKDKDLQGELLRITDKHTDEIFSCVTELGGITVLYNYSRLVLDPERFRVDKKEVMAAKGMGVIYTKDSNGRKLREINENERNLLLQNIYDPYHEAITTEVQELLLKFNKCIIRRFIGFFLVIKKFINNFPTATINFIVNIFDCEGEGFFNFYFL